MANGIVYFSHLFFCHKTAISSLEQRFSTNGSQPSYGSWQFSNGLLALVFMFFLHEHYFIAFFFLKLLNFGSWNKQDWC